MKTRLMIACAFATILLCGCATTVPYPNGIHHDGPFTQELGNSGVKDRDTLLGACRTSCSIAPGPGCC